MRKKIKEVIGRLGYRLERNRTLHPLSGDPREIPYLKNLPYSVVDLSTDRGAGLRFYSLTGNTSHPFVYGLLKSRKDEVPEKALFRILKKYSELVTFQSPNEYLGFVNEEVFPEGNHPYEFTYPWSVVLPAERKVLYLSINRQENLRCGFNSREYLEGSPVSDEKITVETKRLITLLRSIEKNGYRPQYRDALNCFILMKDGEWKWFVESGQHRAAVLSALGHETISAHVRQIVRREEVALWPAVQSGIYTESSALDLFDRMFHLEHPPIAGDWVNYVAENPL